ncbi:MAG: GNAT family N-acetyltransferase [Deltaproteobacteria bacterium]|jgi:ribosomal protein S18 acetylase RimI-like enzyme|nr:GNAT family N-acetyltransferase [Deltaproteobacteria bacterium]
MVDDSVQISVDEAISLLVNEPVRNLPLINLLKLYPKYVSSIHRVGDAVIIRRSQEVNWTSISYCSENNFKKVLQNITDDDLVFDCLETKYFDLLKGNSEVEWFAHANMIILPDDVQVGEPSHEVASLTLNDADIVNDYWEYKIDNTLDYVKHQIENDISASIRIDGRLVAWGMMHDVGAIGFLYVMEECRGQGHAKSLMSQLINDLRFQKRTPFAFVAVENERSHTLSRKLGFVDSGKYSWMKLVR